MKLKGKIAIVTGSAQGIGKVFALGLAHEGASVVVSDILDQRAEDTAVEIRESGGEATAIKSDVSNEKSTVELAQATMEKYGAIDILVNNAALSAGLPMKPFTDITLEEWNQVMLVNAGGMFLCAKAVFPYMKAVGKGKIINISSGTFWRGTNGMIHYVASKGAVIGFTRQLARELGGYGICVNCVTPGLTASEGVLNSFSTEALNALAAERCFKRLEVPEDLVGTIVFLASRDSDFITGQTINVDGGRSFH
jgi:NAD(P)-dependent dehydrogenase (short-subunit alcohol dehydrogenase family)